MIKSFNHKSTRMAVLMFSFSFLNWNCASSGSDPTDGSIDVPDGGYDTCAVDNSRMRSTDPEWKITTDSTAVSGFICPKRDVDHYWFSIDSPETIITVRLSNNIVMSPVDLCYRILPEQENQPAVADVCDHEGMDGMTSLVNNHFLADAGTYFIEVRDESSNEEDPNNAYALQISQIVDPDSMEPNNDKDHATASGQSGQGYISYQGDVDWFAIDVSQSGQLMRINLVSDQTTDLDLRYTLYGPDGSTPVNTNYWTQGSAMPISLSDVLPVPQAGTYYLVIEDEANDEADLQAKYSFQVQLQQNPDPRDRTNDNNGPEKATPISSGVTISDAYLATRADEDWYRLEAPGVNDSSNPALLEIDLVIDNNSPTDPAIDLIVPDPRNSCNAGDSCDTIDWSCNGSTHECASAKCPSHECLEHEGKCRGAGFCTPEGGCAFRHLTMHGANWSTSGNLHHLHTVAPMYSSVYYILVRDFASDNLDMDNSYQLTLTVRDEPDINEAPPNGIYLPYVTNDQDSCTRGVNHDKAVDIWCTESSSFNGLECETITGYLSFRGDQDWFVLRGFSHEDEPSPVQKSTKVDWDVRWEYSFSGKSNLSINYRQYGEKTGFFHNGPASGTFGVDECVYICGEYPKGSPPYYIQIQDNDRKDWDYENPYSLKIRFYRSICPLACKACNPQTTDYACPTHDNPCPQGGCQ